MPNINCSHTGCTYATGDVDNAIVVELLKIHALTHAAAAPQQPTVDTHRQKPPKLTRPSISKGVSEEGWSVSSHMAESL